MNIGRISPRILITDILSAHSTVLSRRHVVALTFTVVSTHLRLQDYLTTNPGLTDFYYTFLLHQSYTIY
jgi:hypothetical protein